MPLHSSTLSTLPLIPGTLPVPVYCHSVQRCLGYVLDGDLLGIADDLLPRMAAAPSETGRDLLTWRVTIRCPVVVHGISGRVDCRQRASA